MTFVCFVCCCPTIVWGIFVEANKWGLRPLADALSLFAFYFPLPRYQTYCSTNGRCWLFVAHGS